jgi:hypothetical protein
MTQVKEWDEDLDIEQYTGIMTYSEIDTDCPMAGSCKYTLPYIFLHYHFRHAVNWTSAFTMADRHYVMMIACQPDTADNINYSAYVSTIAGRIALTIQHISCDSDLAWRL